MMIRLRKLDATAENPKGATTLPLSRAQSKHKNSKKTHDDTSPSIQTRSSKKLFVTLASIFALPLMKTMYTIKQTISDDFGIIVVAATDDEISVVVETNMPYKQCKDPTKIFPLCQKCIPGLIVENNSTKSKCELSSETKEIRKQLFEISASRGSSDSCQVYKYLSTETLRERHRFVGKYLDSFKPKRVLDIGAYTNPIHTFMDRHCPDSVFMLEPCGELSHSGSAPYSSKEVKCVDKNDGIQKSIQHVLPKSIKSFVNEGAYMQHFDAVVCIGCDPNQGPSWKELMTFPRPMHLILESTGDYFHEYYPVKSTDGCTIVKTQNFDFSDCPDCGYNGKKQYRKLLIFECNEHEQYNFSKRVAHAKKILSSFCEYVDTTTDQGMACSGKRALLSSMQINNDTALAKKFNLSKSVAFGKKILSSSCEYVDDTTYRGMACSGERALLSSMHINDTALMALDASDRSEVEDMHRMFHQINDTGKFKNDPINPGGSSSCSGIEIRDFEIARTWWDTSNEVGKLDRAKSYLVQAKNATTNLYEALCFAASARSLFSAAEPQEEMIGHLYDSIQSYQLLLRETLLDSSHQIKDGNLDGYRHKLKTCPPHLDREYMNEVAEMEPILPGGRNLDFRLFGAQISFNPYISLASFESVKTRQYRKKILVDVGANGFAASPKQLVDNYAALGMMFDEVIMFEPDIDGMQYIPDVYKNLTNFTFHQEFVEVGSRNAKTDVISWLSEHVHKDDFLVLKLDVDEAGDRGPTMEWAFLGDLIYSKELDLVDEFYIELHFKAPFWRHQTHSSRQHYDIVRQLRACGMAIHDWP